MTFWKRKTTEKLTLYTKERFVISRAFASRYYKNPQSQNFNKILDGLEGDLSAQKKNSLK